jgi:hypothetical protein
MFAWSFTALSCWLESACAFDFDSLEDDDEWARLEEEDVGECLRLDGGGERDDERFLELELRSLIVINQSETKHTFFKFNQIISIKIKIVKSFDLFLF